MHDSSLLLLTGNDVRSLLEGREREIIDLVRRAYEAHSRGESVLPNAAFLRFAEDVDLVVSEKHRR